MKMGKILITGAGGFLGAGASYYFHDLGYEVFAASRNPDSAWRLAGFEGKKIKLDVADFDCAKKAVEAAGPDAIIHFAAYGAYPGKETDAALMRKTNVNGTENLLRAAEGETSKFLYIGTSSEYGPKEKPISEEDTPAPDTDYGRTKLEASRLVMDGNWDFETVVARPFSPFGFWEEKRRLVPTLIFAALNKEAPKLTTPHSKRDFMFAGDFYYALMKILQKSKINGEVFNISMGHQSSVGEMAGIVNELVPGSPEPVWGSVENPRKEPLMWEADISKAKKILGWEPKNSLRQGLEKTIEWFRENGGKYKEEK